FRSGRLHAGGAAHAAFFDSCHCRVARPPDIARRNRRHRCIKRCAIVLGGLGSGVGACGTATKPPHARHRACRRKRLADTKEQAPPLTGFRDLVAHFEKGPKPDRSTWRIGTEHEKFAFYKDTLEPVPYEGERGIGALLNGLADSYGWQRIKEGENTIALKQGMA